MQKIEHYFVIVCVEFSAYFPPPKLSFPNKFDASPIAELWILSRWSVIV